MMVKCGAIEIIFKPHEAFQSYLLTGQADSAKKARGIFFSLIILIHFLQYETIVSRNGLSLGYSERDTSSVLQYGCEIECINHLPYCNNSQLPIE